MHFLLLKSKKIYLAYVLNIRRKEPKTTNMDFLITSTEEAIAMQQKLQKQINIQPLKKEIVLVGGVDISFKKYEKVIFASIVVVELTNLKEIHRVVVEAEVTFPYIPDLISFRILPAVQKAWNKLTHKPDVLLFNCHGVTQDPLSLASHFGIVNQVPTVGCAGKLLDRNYAEPSIEKGSQAEITENSKVIGVTLRTKNRVKPIFISPGHLINLPQSVKIIKQCDSGHRLPAPIRLAQVAVTEYRKIAHLELA